MNFIERGKGMLGEGIRSIHTEREEEDGRRKCRKKEKKVNKMQMENQQTLYKRIFIDGYVGYLEKTTA